MASPFVIFLLSSFVAAMIVAAWILLCAGAVAALTPVLTLGGAFAFVAALHALLAIAAILAIKSIARAAAERRRAKTAAGLVTGVVIRLGTALFRIARQQRLDAELLAVLALTLVLALLSPSSKRD